MKTRFPFLAFAETEVAHEFGGGVAEPDGHRFVWCFPCEVKGGIPGIGGGARFLGQAESDSSVGENEARFWHADAFDSLEAGSGKGKGAISGKANVFGSEDYHATSDELGIFTGFHHASEVIEGGVGVATAHGFDKCGNCVVMAIAFFVVTGQFATGGFDNSVLGNMII